MERMPPAHRRLRHGRIEIRTICVTLEADRDVPVLWLDFPGACFAPRVKREAVYKKTGQECGAETA